jgi:hypothetical protein
MRPFPTFAEVKKDLLLEELRLSATSTSTPATTLYIAPRTAPSDSGGLHRTSAPPFPGALRHPPGFEGRSRSWPQPRSQGWSMWHVGWPGRLSRWLSVAIPLQLVDWHHPHVARAIRGCLDSSPQPPHWSSLPLHRLLRLWPLLHLSRGSFPSRGLQPSPCGGPGSMGGIPSLSPGPSLR